MKILLRAVSKRDDIAPSAVVIVKQKRFARMAKLREEAKRLRDSYDGVVDRIGINDITVSFYDGQSDVLDDDEWYVLDDARELPWDMGDEIRTTDHICYVNEHGFWWTASSKYNDDYLETMALSWSDFECPLHEGVDKKRIVCLRCAATPEPEWPPDDREEDEDDEAEGEDEDEEESSEAEGG